MKPKRIILVRHGESEANIDRMAHGIKPDYTIELTETGKKQATIAGETIKELVKNESLFFYVSPYWRTRNTFENIAKSFRDELITYREEPRLREQEWGHLRDIETNQVLENRRDAFGTFYFRLPDGESAADVYDRVSDFFGTMHRDFEKEDYPENVVIVSHGMTLRLFLMRWFHWTVEQFEEIANPKNCQIIVLEKRDNDKYQLKSELKKHTVQHSFQRPLKLDY